MCIDDLFDHVLGVNFFYKTYFRSEYHRLRFRVLYIPKTKFRTRYDHYEFLMMSFGLINAPATLLDLMIHVVMP